MNLLRNESLIFQLGEQAYEVTCFLSKFNLSTKWTVFDTRTVRGIDVSPYWLQRITSSSGIFFHFYLEKYRKIGKEPSISNLTWNTFWPILISTCIYHLYQSFESKITQDRMTSIVRARSIYFYDKVQHN
jgi:hypothetical protein